MIGWRSGPCNQSNTMTNFSTAYIGSTDMIMMFLFICWYWIQTCILHPLTVDHQHLAFLIFTVCLFPYQTRPSWKRPVFCRIQLWKAAGQRWTSQSCLPHPPNGASNGKPRTQNQPCLSVQICHFVELQSFCTEADAHSLPTLFHISYHPIFDSRTLITILFILSVLSTHSANYTLYLYTSSFSWVLWTSNKSHSSCRDPEPLMCPSSWNNPLWIFLQRKPLTSASW